MGREKASVLDRNRERVLSRIATRGVVKFFNVCSQEQKDLESKIKNVAGGSERKRDKILTSIDKGSFLDKLKEINDSDDDESNANQNKPSWGVLRDDFILSSKVKDWNKDDEEDDDNDGDSFSSEDDSKSKPPVKQKNAGVKRKNKKFKN